MNASDDLDYGELVLVLRGEHAPTFGVYDDDGDEDGEIILYPLGQFPCGEYCIVQRAVCRIATEEERAAFLVLDGAAMRALQAEIDNEKKAAR